MAALLVAAVYLLCCFLRVEWVPAEQKGRQEPEESSKFFLKLLPHTLYTASIFGVN